MPVRGITTDVTSEMDRFIDGMKEKRRRWYMKARQKDVIKDVSTIASGGGIAMDEVKKKMNE